MQAVERCTMSRGSAAPSSTFGGWLVSHRSASSKIGHQSPLGRIGFRARIAGLHIDRRGDSTRPDPTRPDPTRPDRDRARAPRDPRSLTRLGRTHRFDRALRARRRIARSPPSAAASARPATREASRAASGSRSASRPRPRRGNASRGDESVGAASVAVGARLRRIAIARSGDLCF